jgi:transposase-like protein
MPVKTKASVDEKLRVVQLYESGELSQRYAAEQLGVSQSSVYQWVCLYREKGPLCFKELEYNQSYSPELKLQAVQAYLAGQGSLQVIASRYGLRSKTQLQRWIKMYNEGRDFRQGKLGGRHMKTSRKTTEEERIAIVKDCLDNGLSYNDAAEKHNVSYQQIYNWVRKYSELGEAGLEDRRGKRKENQQPRTELEEMKIKMAKLEHELYRTKVERDLLKKLEELERRDPFRK